MKQQEHFWKQVPFLRLLLPFCCGIISGFYSEVIIHDSKVLLIATPVVFIIYHFLPSPLQYRFRTIPGIVIHLVFYFVGLHVLKSEDVRNSEHWVGTQIEKSTAFHAVIDEPPVERPRTVKTVAKISVLDANEIISKKGKLLIYFEKSEIISQLDYGSQIIFLKKPEPIRRSGNPFAFDYARYCLFQGITHQVYLQTRDFKITRGKQKDILNEFIHQSKKNILAIIKKYIPGDTEAGVAEALLIGYKNDLDKSLVTSYANTGVVHIIAISGLHLGLIYWLLTILLTPLAIFKKTKWLRSIVIIGCLWIFTLLAGAQPSILRSAVMFTCIVLGESIARRTNIYNTIAFSAFILLCINPFWLWDAGFQLSYAAVLSIVIFMKPVYHLYCTDNKLLDLCWKMNAVTISAQILTIPLCLYHFHQFPMLFLLTNFVAVPLSSLILLAEICLCVVSFFSPIAISTGKFISWMIEKMNQFVIRTEAIPFSSWKHLFITPTQAMLLYFTISFFAAALLLRNKRLIYPSLATLLLFTLFRNISFKNAYQQKKVIIYNIAGKTSIDLIKGRLFYYVGDSSVINDEQGRGFHVDPARIAYRISSVPFLGNLYHSNGLMDFSGYRILILTKPFRLNKVAAKLPVDLVLVNAKKIYSLAELAANISIKLLVLGPMLSAGQRQAIKNECNLSGITYFDMQEKGAFVMNLR